MYLSYITTADIAFVIEQLSKQNADPKVRHLKVAKRVVQYLKDTMHLGLTYRAHPKPEKEEKKKAKTKIPVRQSMFGLIWHIDSNYLGDLEDKKSVMGHYFFIYRVLISWYSKKQKTVSTSTTKVEYIALENVVQKSV